MTDWPIRGDSRSHHGETLEPGEREVEILREVDDDFAHDLLTWLSPGAVDSRGHQRRPDGAPHGDCYKCRRVRDRINARLAAIPASGFSEPVIRLGERLTIEWNPDERTSGRLAGIGWDRLHEAYRFSLDDVRRTPDAAIPASGNEGLDERFKDTRERLERRMLEAAAVRQAVLELHRERGRMQKVTVGDFLIVLGGVRNLSDDALRATLEPASPEDTPTRAAPVGLQARGYTLATPVTKAINRAKRTPR